MTRKLAVLILSLLLVAQWTLPSLVLAAGEDPPQAEKQVRVLATTLNVRSGPGTTNSVVASLQKGATAALVEDHGEWLMIRLDDGTMGWAAAKFLEVVAGEEATPKGETKESQPATPAEKSHEKAPAAPSKSGGGSSFRGFLKWSSLIGAAAFGGLAFNERSQGNSSYDDYKRLYNENRKDEAEKKYQEATDHDDKAQTYGIVGGALFGLFLLQQFVFKGDGGKQAGLDSPQTAPALAFNPVTGEMRAGVRVAF
jgi:hypothetical protein